MRTDLLNGIRRVPWVRRLARLLWKVISRTVSNLRRGVRGLDYSLSIFTRLFHTERGLRRIGYGIILLFLMPFFAVRNWQLKAWLRGALKQQSSIASGAEPLVLMGIGTLGPGGSERQLTRIAIAMQNSFSLQVKVITGDLHGPFEDFYLKELETNGIQVLRYRSPGSNNSGKSRNVFFALSLLNRVYALSQQISELKPRVVHCWLDQTNVELGLAAVLSGTPRVILTVRSLPPFNFRFYQWYMRVIYRELLTHESVTIVSNSYNAAKEYEEWLGLKPDHISVIPNALDLPSSISLEEILNAKKTRMSKPDYAPRVGGVMRLVPEKDPRLWLNVALEMDARGIPCEFALAGDGPLRLSLIEQLERVSRVNDIQFHGLVTDPLQFLSEIDILLSTSRIEGLPNVLLEAQSLGVFVVATAVGGSPETFIEGKTGLSIENRNANDIADLLSILVKSPSKLIEASDLAVTHTHNRFRLNQVCKDWITLYRL